MSLYRIPILLGSGQENGVPFRLYLDQLSGQIYTAYDFESLRRDEENRTRVALLAARKDGYCQRDGYHKQVKR